MMQARAEQADTETLSADLIMRIGMHRIGLSGESVESDSLYQSPIPSPPSLSERLDLHASETGYTNVVPLFKSRVPSRVPQPPSSIRAAIDSFRHAGSDPVYLSSIPPPPPRLVYESPDIQVTSLHQMDSEFSFLQRLAGYGMISRLSYTVGSKRGYDGKKLPASTASFSVSRGDRLTDFYAAMHAAVQHGQPFEYHFWRECTAPHLNS